MTFVGTYLVVNEVLGMMLEPHHSCQLSGEDFSYGGCSGGHD
jgi:hypothetical protein